MVFLVVLFLHLLSAKIYFIERFADKNSPLKNWTQSRAKTNYGKVAYFPGNKTCNFENNGMQTTEDSKIYSISAHFAENFNTAGKDLIFQYTTRAVMRLGCAGTYLKLMPRLKDIEKMDDSVPSTIIFGPDVCGTDAEVKVMVEYNNKLYKLKEKVRYMVDDLGQDTHLFSLILFKNQSYEVRIDNKSVRSGDLLSDLDLKEPKMIQDTESIKPEDWDDRKMIPNPDDLEPSDWVKEKLIVDKDDVKPDDWDSELFGEWSANIIQNPAYRGEYRRKEIYNANYMGEWTAPIIMNPYFREIPNSLQFNLGTVALEVWQVESKTVFSNILVTDSREESEDFINNSFLKIQKSCDRPVRFQNEDQDDDDDEDQPINNAYEEL